jgi:hypothetical protein
MEQLPHYVSERDAKWLDKPTVPTGQRARTKSQLIRAAEILQLMQVPHSDDVDDCVRQFSRIAAKLADADGCTILLLAEGERERLVFRRYASPVGEGSQPPKQQVQSEERAAREAVASGKSVVIASPSHALWASGDGAAGVDAYCIVSAPIRTGSTIVGAVSAIGNNCCPDAVATVEIAAWTIGHALQASRLQKLLRSQFAQTAVAEEARTVSGDVVAISNERSGQLARILAKSFYREMVKLGLESNQIVGAASEIISQLSTNLKMHRQRLQRNQAKRSPCGVPAA